MKLVTWNVNSVRARKERLLSWLTRHAPDVACLQELKCQDEQFPRAEVEALGYHVETYGQKTYNGVAILSRQPLASVERAIPDGAEDPQARVLSARLPVADTSTRLVCVYVPNGQAVGAPAYAYKLEWYARLTAWLVRTRQPGEGLIVCGDFNVAPADADVYDAQALSGQVLCSEDERRAFHALGSALGLADAFRHLHTEAGHYSWWDYRAAALRRNLGLRIDTFLVSEALLPKVRACHIDVEERRAPGPSDHAPVVLDVS